MQLLVEAGLSQAETCTSLRPREARSILPSFWEWYTFYFFYQLLGMLITDEYIWNTLCYFFLLLNTKARLAQFSFPMIHLHEKSVCFYIILYDLTVLGRGSNHSWSFHQTQLGHLRLWWNSLVFVHSKIYYTKIKMSHCQFLPILCSPGLISWPL